MLSRLDLEHFKCFQVLSLPLGRLTLLSGANATGKSSVMQSLVLLHQTMNEHEWSRRLMLNGGELSLGTVTDVTDKLTSRGSFRIGLEDSGNTVSWLFSSKDRRDMSASVAEVRLNGQGNHRSRRLRFLFPTPSPSRDPSRSKWSWELARRLRTLTYLTAERVGPRDVYTLSDPSKVQVVGPRGENAASLLHWGRDDKVLEALAIPDTPPTLLRQVDARMREFFPGCSLEVQQVPQANAITLGVRTSPETDYHRPVHVGFGLTQALPIFVAALAAKPDDLLLIENPEVHLHPAGQALMGGFLARVAAAGVQVLIETHSDHVLNGVRRAVKTGVIPHTEVVCHYFRQRGDGRDQVVSPLIDPGGGIDAWPPGFFDQFDRDTSFFAGWGD